MAENDEDEEEEEEDQVCDVILDLTSPDEEKCQKVTFDDILAELGEFGLEQKINYILFSLPYILTSMQLMGWVFVGADLVHRCRLPGDPISPGDSIAGGQNSTSNYTFNDYNPYWRSESCSRKVSTSVTSIYVS